jgi:ribonuclease VapC
MIVDSSVIIAILKREPDWSTLADALDRADRTLLSAANYLESVIVIDGWRNPILSAELDELIERFGIAIEPVTAEQAKIARQAYRDYGPGSGHAANLNFGDCFSYALARAKREPLLFKGADFSLTDVRSAMNP